MSGQERNNALKAVEVIRRAGGRITFNEYDKAMAGIQYFIPLSWCIGWGLTPLARKANTDKLCVFKACQLGLIKQTAGGYILS